MPRDTTQYGYPEDEPDLTEELRNLDWVDEPNQSVQEAAELIYEIWSSSRGDDEPSIQELLAEVPVEFRDEVSATVHERYLSAAESSATENLDDFQATQDPVEAGLQWDLERIQHVLDYVESVCGEETAYRLEQLITDGRNLSLRQLTGDPVTYDGDVHERYVQCVIDLPAAVEAKQAMEHAPWDQAQLHEAVQHEVNRMGYRLNLEIQDRLLTQLSYGGSLARLAREQNMSEDVVGTLATEGTRTAQWAEMRRNGDDPLLESINAAAYLYAANATLEIAIELNDEATVRAMLDPSMNQEEREAIIERTTTAAAPETTAAVEAAMEIAAYWSDEEILDGAQDYHAQFADLRYRPSNQERETWLANQPDRNRRTAESGDCAVRALNEATGGGNYGPIWTALTERTKTQYPTEDADDGMDPRLHRDIFLNYGMQPVLEASVDTSNFMRKHLDLREVPILLGHLFPDPEQPLTYIACSETHAVAVVDGTAHDNWDSRDMGDRTLHTTDYSLTELWLRTSPQETLGAAREIIDRYETVQRYDEALTYGTKRRETVTRR